MEQYYVMPGREHCMFVARCFGAFRAFGVLPACLLPTLHALTL
jgi:hypothetical protein